MLAAVLNTVDCPALSPAAGVLPQANGSVPVTDEVQGIESRRVTKHRVCVTRPDVRR